MSTLVKGTPRLLMVACPLQVPGFAFGTLYKAGLPVAVSDGGITENGDDSVTVSFDAADLDTVGDFTFCVKDGAGVKFWSVGSDVWDDPIGLLANDGLADIKLNGCYIINNSGLTALQVESVGGTEPAVKVISAGDGIEIVGAVSGLNIHSGISAIYLHDCDRGIFFETMVDGIFQQSITNVGCLFQGNNIGLAADGINGIGLLCSGIINGQQIFCTAGTPPVNTVCGLSIRADSNAVRVRSTSAVGILVTAATSCVSMTSTSGTAVLYEGVDLLLAIADKIFNLVDGIETGRTLKWALRIILAATGGKSFLLGNTRTYRDTNDTVNRISATTDNFGQRSAVTYNA